MIACTSIKRAATAPGGAYRDPHSPYRSWYCWKDAAANMYESWWGFQSLPKLNSRDESWREFLCGENGIVRHWLRLGADGWRLDVVDEYPDELVRMIRQAARAEKPDALIIGEVWEDASCKEAYGEHRQYLMGHELDSVMNYPLRQAILDFLLRGDGAAFRLRLWELLEHYPRPCWDVMMNLLSSHDVPRRHYRAERHPHAAPGSRLAARPQYPYGGAVLPGTGSFSCWAPL